MSNHGSFQTCTGTFSPFLLGLFVIVRSSNFKLAPFIIRYLMISPFPYKIYFSSVILNVCRAIYSGHLCYFKHLHSKFDFFMMSFINSMHVLYWLFDVPFFWLTVAVFLMNKLKLLINFPFSSSNIAFGLAPASSTFFAV